MPLLKLFIAVILHGNFDHKEKSEKLQVHIECDEQQIQINLKEPYEHFPSWILITLPKEP